MAVSDAKKKANAKWNAENLDKVQFYAPKGFNRMINDRVAETGLSKAKYMQKAITEEIQHATDTHIVIKKRVD